MRYDADTRSHRQTAGDGGGAFLDAREREREGEAIPELEVARAGRMGGEGEEAHWRAGAARHCKFRLVNLFDHHRRRGLLRIFPTEGEKRPQMRGANQFDKARKTCRSLLLLIPPFLPIPVSTPLSMISQTDSLMKPLLLFLPLLRGCFSEMGKWRGKGGRYREIRLRVSG